MTNLRFVDAFQLADEIDVSRSAVYRLQKRGDIPGPFVLGLWWLDDVLRFMRGVPLPGDAAEAELRRITEELLADRERSQPRYSDIQRRRLWRRVRALNRQAGNGMLGRLDAMQDTLRGGDDDNTFTPQPQPELSSGK